MIFLAVNHEELIPKECHQFLVATSGSFEVLLDDGITRRQVLLNRPDIGLHILPHLGFGNFF
jgi:hypothetical protein